MLAAAVSKCIIKARIAMFLPHYPCSSCHRRFSFATLWGIRSLFGIFPFFRVLSNLKGNHQPIATQASSLDLSDEILNQIHSHAEDPTASTERVCASHIDKLCSGRDLLAASRLLQSLHSKSIFPGLSAYNCLLKAAVEQHDLDILSQSFKDLLITCESISSAPFLILAEALVRKNDNDFLLSFLKKVSDLNFPRNITVMNRMIFAFGELREVDKALLIFDQMKILKCKPDLVTYNTILAVLGRCGRVDDLLHKFASMRDSNLTPDTISYNTLINSLRKVGRLDLCKTFFKEMSERGAGPDLRTYTALIDSFGRSGNVEEALSLFEEMKQRRVRPSIYIYRSLISNLKKMGKPKLATKLLKEMEASLSDLVGPRDFKKKRR